MIVGAMIVGAMIVGAMIVWAMNHVFLIPAASGIVIVKQYFNSKEGLRETRPGMEYQNAEANSSNGLLFK